jgi:hypothetical protein
LNTADTDGAFRRRGLGAPRVHGGGTWERVRVGMRRTHPLPGGNPRVSG